MSLLTPSIMRKAIGTVATRNAAGSIARLLPILTMVAFTVAILPNSGCGKGFFPQVTSSATATTVPSTTPSSTASASAPSRAFKMRGSGSQTSAQAGTCSGQGCGASLGDCECLMFQGTLLSTVIGNSSWTASITLNLDDCTNTGTSGGSCCTGDGVFTASNGTGKSAGVLALSFTGPDCLDPNSGFDTSLEANFAISPSSSSGRFANSTGTGQINLFTNSTDGSNYLAISGEVQLGGP